MLPKALCDKARLIVDSADATLFTRGGLIGDNGLTLEITGDVTATAVA
jgi:hypothetical protein